MHIWSTSSPILLHPSPQPPLSLHATLSTFSNPVTADVSPNDPFTYQEALRSHDVAQWVHAMTDKIDFLKDNKTWELLRFPNGRKAIKCKWVFKTKYLPNDIVDKFKAPLVAKLGLITLNLSHLWLNLKMSASSWPSLQQMI